MTQQTGSDRERLTEWWNGRDVREARERVGYDVGESTLADVLVELLVVLDEQEAEASALPEYPVSLAYKLAANDFAAGHTCRRHYANAAITQLLDLGAEPAKIKDSGAFDPAEVDRVAAKWAPWREVAVTMARRGATPDEIRAAIPKNISWNPYVTEVLAAHGMELPQPTDRRKTATEKNQRILELHEAGLPNVKIAAELGCTRQLVGNVVRAARAA